MTTVAAATTVAVAKKRSPSDFLKSVLGRPVRVKLNSGIEYRGVLACLDGYMNIAMEQTEEFVDGQLKAKYGDCFIRGNNGTCVESVVPMLKTDMISPGRAFIFSNGLISVFHFGLQFYTFLHKQNDDSKLAVK